MSEAAVDAGAAKHDEAWFSARASRGVQGLRAYDPGHDLVAFRRKFGEALVELTTLSARKAVVGDGFADGFPTAELAALLKARIARPELTKADWVAFSVLGRT